MEATPTPLTALLEAIRRYGSQPKLAAACSVSQTAVSKWKRDAKRLPAEHVLAVEADTGVSRHDLRPDIYPRDLAPSAEVIAACRAPASCARQPEMQPGSRA